MKALHLICEPEGSSLKGLEPVGGGVWRSCCWLLSEAEAQDLIGGWLYLHEAKAKKSRFGGVVRAVESRSLDGVARSERYVIEFEAKPGAKGQKWRGADHGMAYRSGLVEASLSHEQEAQNA